jgi:formylglycine-generating enzyme required for sulfatase activity
VSQLGVFDLAGNLREWTSSKYAAHPGGKSEKGRRGLVNRGGSYLMRQTEFSATYTRGVDRARESRPGIGFRCAAEL